MKSGEILIKTYIKSTRFPQFLNNQNINAPSFDFTKKLSSYNFSKTTAQVEGIIDVSNQRV